MGCRVPTQAEGNCVGHAAAITTDTRTLAGGPGLPPIYLWLWICRKSSSLGAPDLAFFRDLRAYDVRRMTPGSRKRETRATRPSITQSHGTSKSCPTTLCL